MSSVIDSERGDTCQRREPRGRQSDYEYQTKGTRVFVCQRVLRTDRRNLDINAGLPNRQTVNFQPTQMQHSPQEHVVKTTLCPLSSETAHLPLPLQYPKPSQAKPSQMSTAKDVIFLLFPDGKAKVSPDQIKSNPFLEKSPVLLCSATAPARRTSSVSLARSSTRIL